MEPEQIENYQQTLLDNVFSQKLEQNEKQIKTWTNYKNRHKKVIEGLQIFPLSVSENCMVPIGKRALMKGKLTRTNEILVCLGNGYFAKYSASQAIALCNRRIAWADEMLKSLETEKNLYEMRQILPLEHDVFEKESKDIVEHWNENKLDEWRVQHRQREKEYNRKRAELRENERDNVCTEVDFFSRLNELELEEELGDEICRLEAERKGFYCEDLEEEGEVYDESEEYDTSDSDKITIEELEEELKKLKDIKSDKILSDVKDATSSDATRYDILNTNTMENERSNHPVNFNPENLERICSPGSIFENIDMKKKGRISFVEHDMDNENNTEGETSRKDCSLMRNTIHRREEAKDDEDIIKIKFSHSSYIPNTSESSNLEIQSPVDIYKIFFVPKSILKRSLNDMVPNQATIPINDDSSTDTEDDVKSSVYESVIKEEIQETKLTSCVKDISIKRDKKKIVSRFKKDRATLKT